MKNLLLICVIFITISCNSDNEPAPLEPVEVTLQDLETTIAENPTDGQAIGTIQTDGNETSGFSITSEMPTGALSIDATSGELNVADASLFDFEINRTITATVTADNALNMAAVTINLTNVNEVTPENLEVTIDENPTDGQVLGTVQASGGESFNFSITTQSPEGALSIDAASGEVAVAQAILFDFETNPVITASISTDDAENMGTVTINLTNVNEITLLDLEVTIDENPTDGQLIGTIQADEDETSGFNITSQSPEGALSIDANSGELMVVDATLFDFETNPVITATIAVADGINTATATINLNDVQELTLQDLTVSIDENPTDGQVLGTMQTNGSGALSFSISTQTPSGALSIGANTGELTVIDPNLFDFEANPVITATILVDDGIETAMATATINLNDVDEVSAQNTDLTIDENPSNGAVVGTLQANGANLTYTITSQNPAGAFNINQSTGELSVADETLFDFETNPNMLATISVSNGTQTVSANAFVALNDLNEIGEFKFGGVIFWIDPASNNSEGLVCTIIDLNNGNSTIWNNGSNIGTGATATAIGSGQVNTTTIVNAQGSGTYAASLCDNLNLNSYTDWYLPSIDELGEIYTNRALINTTAAANGGTNFNVANWSSTEQTGNVNNALIYLFVNGQSPSLNAKANQAHVRAVRSWTDF